jgi:hypothetical protein
MAERL